MAKAKKCDRCGKFYTENKASVGTDVWAGVATTTERGTVYKSYDLCDECINKFFDFMCCFTVKGEDE